MIHRITLCRLKLCFLDSIFHKLRHERGIGFVNTSIFSLSVLKLSQATFQDVSIFISFSILTRAVLPETCICSSISVSDYCDPVVFDLIIFAQLRVQFWSDSQVEDERKIIRGSKIQAQVRPPEALVRQV